MGKTKIYFVFTDTGTNLSKIINYFTKQSLNHVSLAFDVDLTEVYSFGRKHPKNPFSGGFVREDIRSDFLRNAKCAIYSFEVTKTECEAILKSIQKVEKNQDDYKYNFLGLIGVLFKIRIHRKRAFFCSEFIATMLSNTQTIQLSKPTYFVTPFDIRSQLGLKLIYEGKLGDYRREFIIEENKLIKDSIAPKQSFVLYISQKVKRFVIR